MRRNAALAPAIVALIATAALAAHFATLARYGFYRDELYFLACAHRMAWGFVDQPPLVPLIAAFSLPFGGSLFFVRIFCALASFATILVADRIAKDLGGRLFARMLTATAVALMPGVLFLGNTLTTTSFEPLSWTLAIWFTLRLLDRSDPRYAVLLMADVGIASYMKYSILLLCAALIVSAFAVRERRLAASVLLATFGAAVALLPNLAWQAAHGFPFPAVVAGDLSGRHPFNAGPQYEFSGAAANAPAFIVEQFAFAGLFAAPLWIAAIVRSRILAATYALLFAAGILLAAKGYYIIGVYPALVAAGSVRVAGWARGLRGCALAAVLAGGVILMPLSLPVLPVDSLVAHMHAFGAPPMLMQPLFADEFGWRELTAAVAAQYDALPPPLRSHTPIFSDTYAGAAALEYYGGPYHLPAAISGQNQYYLWGRRGYSLRTLLAFGASQYATLREVYGSVRMVGTFSSPYRRVIEGPTPIYLCTQPRYSDDEIWRRLRWYGA